MSTDPITKTFPCAYWVIPGRFLAGQYPGDPNPARARARIAVLLQAGITCFINLTEAEEGIKPYHALLEEEAVRLGVAARHVRLPIVDFTAPTPETMRRIQAVLRASLASGENIYLHCLGGHGRTGTAVGCFLVEQGLTGAQALEQIRLWRLPTPLCAHPSPENDKQVDLVLSWPRKGGEATL